MKLVVGYIPEHFSTPIFFAKDHGFFSKLGLEIEFRPFPSGSGHLIQCLEDKSINVAVGLTEAFVRGIAAGSSAYKIVGTYVQSPLCWAVSTGADRDITSVDQLEGGIIGVSRMGSGSDVMSKVLLHQKGWKEPFKYAINNDFKNLRDGVNHTGTAKPCDAFMWEHFTSKKYYDSGEIKRIGEIFTPWPSWIIAASPEVIEEKTALKSFITAVNEGIEYFNGHHDEAVKWISSNLDYSSEDAQSWLKTVKFSTDAGKIEPGMIKKTLDTLKLAVELPESADSQDYYATV